MPDYSANFSQLAGEIGELKGMLEGTIRSLGEAKAADVDRFKVVLARLDAIKAHLEQHDSKSGRDLGSVDGATVELKNDHMEMLSLLRAAADRRAYWHPIVHTLVKSLVPSGLGTAVLALIWYIIQYWVEIGAALAGFR